MGHMLDNYTINDFYLRFDTRYYIKHKEDAIMEYLEHNPGATEYKVVKFMIDNKFAARATTHNLILSLIDKGKIVDRKEGNSSSSLFINDENHYNQLVDSIEKLSTTAREWTNAVKSNSKLFDSRKGADHLNLTFFAQIRLYEAITGISTHVEKVVKLPDDREKLFLLLNEVLRNSYGVYKAIRPWVINRLEQSAKKHKNLEIEDSNFIAESRKVLQSVSANGRFPNLS